MVRRAHDLHRALDVNGNRKRMRNRAIVQSCVRAFVLYNVRVHAAALRMCLARPPGCRDYAARIRLRLVLWRMSLLWRAVHVHGPYSYTGCNKCYTRRKGVCTYTRVRCRYEV